MCRKCACRKATAIDVDAVEGASLGELAGNVIADDPTLDYTYGYEDGEDDAPTPTTIARVWAPDYIIHQAGHRTVCCLQLPRAMRVAPDAKTWQQSTPRRGQQSNCGSGGQYQRTWGITACVLGPTSHRVW